MRGSLDIVQHLVTNHADVNLKDKRGETALHSAVYSNHLDIVQYLVTNHADVNLQDNNGHTALLRAAANNHLDIVQHLVTNHADVNLQDKRGETALHWAASNNHLDIVQHLVTNHADVNLQDKNGHTALLRAASNNHLDIVQHLVTNHADVNLQNKSGNTPLLVAALHGLLPIIRYLFDQQKQFINVNQRNKDGDYAWDLADINGHQDVALYLYKSYSEHYPAVLQQPSKKRKRKESGQLVADKENLLKKRNFWSGTAAIITWQMDFFKSTEITTQEESMKIIFKDFNLAVSFQKYLFDNGFSKEIEQLEVNNNNAQAQYSITLAAAEYNVINKEGDTACLVSRRF
jgi:ankyrin repeat protein